MRFNVKNSEQKYTKVDMQRKKLMLYTESGKTIKLPFKNINQQKSFDNLFNAWQECSKGILYIKLTLA